MAKGSPAARAFSSFGVGSSSSTGFNSASEETAWKVPLPMRKGFPPAVSVTSSLAFPDTPGGIGTARTTSSVGGAVTATWALVGAAVAQVTVAFAPPGPGICPASN